jgi:D-alanyl-lipoteichoic acid acyltransferase DltB (MBOAT superfamily)
MLFSSWQFIFVFLPVTVSGFFLIPSRSGALRKIWLLLTSIYFYAYWKVEYLPLLFFSIVFNYSVAEVMARHRGGRTARLAIYFGMGVNLLLLSYYKYTNFVAHSLGLIVKHDVGPFDIVLPLAISFFTFTQISYLVDVYRDQTLHYRFLDYALFVLFFPHLIAGPIVRHWEIIPQYAERALRADRTDLSVGLAFFLIGLYKKVLLADNLAGYVASVYGAATQGTVLSCFDAWLGTIAFGLQIYFDFSGYSDMAIGLARMFGIKFPMNFNSPYQAGSIIEFWRRWHMSLTRFLREYVYFPLGGNRRGPRRQALNIMGTFLLSGLWHGAGWNFVVWGGLHGLFLAVASRWRALVQQWEWRTQRWAYRAASGVLTFLLITLTWAFFRAPKLSVATRVVASMCGQHGLTIPESLRGVPGSRLLTHVGAHFVPHNLQVPSYQSVLLLTSVMALIAVFFPNSQQCLAGFGPVLEKVELRPGLQLKLRLADGIALGGLFFWVVRSYYASPPSPFLYFNF